MDREVKAGALDISAVLPAFNEAGSLPAVVRGLLPVLAQVSARFELIIVDDGSTDGTGMIADELAAKDERVRVLRHERNRGYGAALRTGFEAALQDWIFFMDADGQFDPADLKSLAALAAGHDFVAGFRAARADSRLRRLYGRAFSALVRALFGVKAKDVNCAFKLFKKELIQGRDFISSGALINAELLSMAGQQGVDPVEIPVMHQPRLAGRQSGASLKVILRAARELAALWLKM